MKPEFRSRVVKDKTKYDRKKSFDDADIDICIQDFDELVDRDTLPDKYQNGYWE